VRYLYCCQLLLSVIGCCRPDGFIIFVFTSFYFYYCIILDPFFIVPYLFFLCYLSFSLLIQLITFISLCFMHFLCQSFFLFPSLPFPYFPLLFPPSCLSLPPFRFSVRAPRVTCSGERRWTRDEKDSRSVSLPANPLLRWPETTMMSAMRRGNYAHYFILSIYASSYFILS